MKGKERKKKKKKELLSWLYVFGPWPNMVMPAWDREGGPSEMKGVDSN